MSAVAWRLSPVPAHSGTLRVRSRPPSEASASVAEPAQRPVLDLEVRFLAELASAYSDIHSQIGQTLLAPSAAVPDLTQLRVTLRRRLDAFLETLLSCADEADAIDVLVPFVFFVDEQVERALSASAAPGNWPQLQRDLFAEGRAEGGDVFYERAEALLAAQPARPLVIATYLFCLKANFKGRLADAPAEAVEHWIRALSAALPLQIRHGEAQRASFRAPRSKATYAWLTVSAIFAWQLVLFTWAYFR